MRKKMVVDDWLIRNVSDAKKSGLAYLKTIHLDKVITFGLPEIDDRYAIWRLPLCNLNKEKIGEIVIDGKSSLIDVEKTTATTILENRLLGRSEKVKQRKSSNKPHISMLRNTIALGDSELILSDMPAESVDLIFTSPPYFNARPEYAEYLEYNDYLAKMQRVIHQCARVLNEGRFFVINVSPVLLRRASRSEQSKRIAVPFDFHTLFIKENFDFIDDIIWEKPEGAGWATGRGRRFAADRNPLQYKPVPITEYILVYRKHTDKLIDWSIRNHPDQAAVRDSKIQDGYERTNIWKITPTHSKKHPAVFPDELAERVINYYSFKNDVVLDPFAGSGTTCRAAHKLQRRFCYIEQKEEYVDDFKSEFDNWFHEDSKLVNCINTSPIISSKLLFG